MDCLDQIIKVKDLYNSLIKLRIFGFSNTLANEVPFLKYSIINYIKFLDIKKWLNNICDI